MQQLPYIAEIFVLAGIASAIVIAADLRTCRQPMRIMQAVWILTGLWANLFGLKAYFVFGRAGRCRIEKRGSEPEARNYGNGNGNDGAASSPADSSGGEPESAKEMHGMERMRGSEQMHDSEEVHESAGMHGTEKVHESAGMRDMHQSAQSMEVHRMAGMVANKTEAMPGMRMDEAMAGMRATGAMSARPRWQSVVLSTLHCGAGCTLADLVGEWFLFFVPVTVAGSLIAGTWIVDYLLALLFGIGFQYAAIREMEPRASANDILRRAAKADILSLTAWQAGMYGWMAFVIFGLNDGMPLPRTTFGFWFMMQIAMACGFAVSLPVNVYLIRKGIKHGM